MSKFTITGLGNAVVDQLLQVQQDTPAQYNITLGQGSWSHPADEVTEILNDFGPGRFSSGGSVANTLDSLSKLKMPRLAYVAAFGNDEAGQCFEADLKTTGITNTGALVETSNALLCLITPDGERTFVSPGFPAELVAQNVTDHAELFTESELLLIEGYTLGSQFGAVQAALDLARENGTKVALTLANVLVIQHDWQLLVQLLESGVDILFANAEEHKALLEKAAAHQDNGALLASLNATLQIITRSGEGASAYQGGAELAFESTTHIEEPVDTTGAGDAFAAGFLCQYLQNGADLRAAMQLGHRLAAKVIMQVGARLPAATVEHVLSEFTAKQQAA